MDIVIKNYTEQDFLKRFDLLNNNSRILNAGSQGLRYGDNCINIDIEDGPNVDFICDIHDLPEKIGKFDAIISNAVLQQCVDPDTVAKQFYKVLNDGGLLYTDIPWVQPDCSDNEAADRHRFSEIALRHLFRDFEIIEIGPSIRPGSAFFQLGMHIAMTMTKNRYINYILSRTTMALLFPLRYIRTAQEHHTAGAFYTICRKNSAK